MSDCIFCKIARGEIKSEIVYDDGSIIGFKDIQPQAPSHVVVIPKKHIPTMNDVAESDSKTLAALLQACARIAMKEGFADNGYRIVINCNRDGGQLILHLHAHLLAGREMGWPPG
jgi:histidine triad (HIT) family protein